MTKKDTSLLYPGIALIAIVFLLVLFAAYTPKDAALGGNTDPKCTTSSIAAVPVANTSTLLVATSSNVRAFTRIQQRVDVNGTATSTIYLAFNQGAAATANSGLALNATTTQSVDHIDFGLNTDFPYVGAVYGITSTGATSVLVTTCDY